jgi:hypothetical protein
MTEEIEREVEIIQLCSISRYGYPAIPQNYAFLQKYGLTLLYFEAIIRRTTGMDYRSIDKAIQETAATCIPRKYDLSALRKYQASQGDKGLKELIENDKYYWRILVKELKKTSR